MTETKPCGRAVCPNVITGPPYRLTRRVYCSTGCATRDRIAKGCIAHAFITPEARARGARLGGKTAGEHRHRATLEKAVRACAGLLTPELTDGLSSRQLAAFKVLVGRAFVLGYTRERNRADSARRYAEKQQQKGKAA
jgi:hypothetical protein